MVSRCIAGRSGDGAEVVPKERRRSNATKGWFGPLTGQCAVARSHAERGETSRRCACASVAEHSQSAPRLIAKSRSRPGWSAHDGGRVRIHAATSRRCAAQTVATRPKRRAPRVRDRDSAGIGPVVSAGQGAHQSAALAREGRPKKRWLSAGRPTTTRARTRASRDASDRSPGVLDRRRVPSASRGAQRSHTPGSRGSRRRSELDHDLRSVLLDPRG